MNILEQQVKSLEGINQESEHQTDSFTHKIKSDGLSIKNMSARLANLFDALAYPTITELKEKLDKLEKEKYEVKIIMDLREKHFVCMCPSQSIHGYGKLTKERRLSYITMSQSIDLQDFEHMKIFIGGVKAFALIKDTDAIYGKVEIMNEETYGFNYYNMRLTSPHFGYMDFDINGITCMWKLGIWIMIMIHSKHSLIKYTIT